MNKQKGFAHESIIIGVIIAILIGTLGFIFWQNFIQKDSDDQSTVSTQDKDQKSPVDTAKYVVIDTWGVKFDALADETGIEWAVGASGDDSSVGFLTTKLTKSDMCSAQNSAAGSLKRSSEPIVQPVAGSIAIVNDNKAIDGYYYGFMRPNGQHCENENPSDYDEAIRIEALVQSLQAL